MEERMNGMGKGGNESEEHREGKQGGEGGGGRRGRGRGRMGRGRKKGRRKEGGWERRESKKGVEDEEMHGERKREKIKTWGGKEGKRRGERGKGEEKGEGEGRKGKGRGEGGIYLQRAAVDTIIWLPYQQLWTIAIDIQFGSN